MDEVKKKHTFRFRTNTSLLFFAKATSMEWGKKKLEEDSLHEISDSRT